MDRSGSFLPQYISTRATTLFLSALLLITGALFSVSAGFEISEVSLFVGVMNDGSISDADRYTHNILRDGLAISRALAIGTTAILFIVWLHRSRINGRAFGARRFDYSRKWSMLCFVVPPLNLVRPLQVVSEVWRVSDPRAVENPYDWKLISVPRFVQVWWWMLVGCAALEVLGMSLTQTTSVTLQQLTFARGITVFADMTATVAAVLGYLVVSGISAAQDHKWAILSGLDVAPEALHPSDTIGDPAIAALL